MRPSLIFQFQNGNETSYSVCVGLDKRINVAEYKEVEKLALKFSDLLINEYLDRNMVEMLVMIGFTFIEIECLPNRKYNFNCPVSKLILGVPPLKDLIDKLMDEYFNVLEANNINITDIPKDGKVLNLNKELN